MDNTSKGPWTKWQVPIQGPCNTAHSWWAQIEREWTFSIESFSVNFLVDTQQDSPLGVESVCPKPGRGGSAPLQQLPGAVRPWMQHPATQNKSK